MSRRNVRKRAGFSNCALACCRRRVNISSRNCRLFAVNSTNVSSLSSENFISASTTPPDVVKSIQEHVAKALADPQVRTWLVSTGQEPVGNSPAEFSAQYKADVERYAKAIEAAKIPKQQ